MLSKIEEHAPFVGHYKRVFTDMAKFVHYVGRKKLEPFNFVFNPDFKNLDNGAVADTDPIRHYPKAASTKEVKNFYTAPRWDGKCVGCQETYTSTFSDVLCAKCHKRLLGKQPQQHAGQKQYKKKGHNVSAKHQARSKSRCKKPTKRKANVRYRKNSRRGGTAKRKSREEHKQSDEYESSSEEEGSSSEASSTLDDDDDCDEDNNL